MKCYKFILVILVIFFQTKTLLSNQNIFNVNNIELIKKTNISNDESANMAIKKGFKELIKKILLDNDIKKMDQLSFDKIRELVLYYQVSSSIDEKKKEKLLYNIYFDKEKLHKLFYDKNIFYSEALNKELYILPVLKKNKQLFIYNNNYFYENWNKVYKNEIVEFILPIENIEIIQNININKNNLLNLDLRNIFQEYTEKDLALILIDIQEKNCKIYLKTSIQGNKIDKNILLKKLDFSNQEFYENIISQTSNEIVNIIKSQNLIDIRTPSFLNTKLLVNNKNNLAELSKRLKKIDSIDDIFIQEFNKDFILIKIKYLGKLDKIIRKLEQNEIILELKNDEWSLKII